MSEQSPSATPDCNRARLTFTWLTAACTFVLIWVGGLVTSKGVGLAVPDWPNTYGYNLFWFPVEKWMGGIFYEHTHRLLGALAGFLTSVLAVWFFGRGARTFLRWFGAVAVLAGVAGYFLLSFQFETKLTFLIVAALALAASFFWPSCGPASLRLRALGVIAVVAVCFQGLLGGLRVTWLKDEIGILHAALAQLFLILVVTLALLQTRWWKGLSLRRLANQKGLRAFYAGLALLIFAQLLIGAGMRHQHAGLAIPDFPLAHGKIWPDTSPEAVLFYNQSRIEVRAYNDITAFQIKLQMVHRMVAALILVATIAAVWLTRRRAGPNNPLATLSWTVLVLVVAQVFLGAATIWTGKMADVATAHVAVGAVTLVIVAMLCLISHKLMAAGSVKGPSETAPASSPVFPKPAVVSPVK